MYLKNKKINKIFNKFLLISFLAIIPDKFTIDNYIFIVVKLKSYHFDHEHIPRAGFASGMQ